MISNFFMWMSFWMWIPTDVYGVTFQKKFLIACSFTLITRCTNQLLLDGGDILLHIVVGSLVAFPISVCIDALSMSGELFNTSRGQSLDVTYAPMEARPLHTLSKIYSGYLLCVMFEKGALYEAIRFLLRSQFSNVTSLHEISQILFFMLYKSIVLCITFIAPYFLLVIVIELAFSSLVKVFPNSSFQSESFIIKMISGFLFLEGMMNFGNAPYEFINTALEWVFLYV